jgi:microcystin-dependent protein
MSYFSGIDQRVRQQQFFNNSSTITQPANQTDTLLLANLQYVQNWFNSNILSYLPINNPTFTGTLSTLAGLINVPSAIITNATITTANITNQGATLFSSNPNININAIPYPVQVRIVGEIKMLMASTIVPYYLNCDGGSYSTTTYATLFNKIGFAYGGDSVSGLFNVPNFSSRFPIGNNSSLNGVPTSNYATGNGGSGLTNTFQYSYNYLNKSSNTTPILVNVPEHSHSIAISDSIGSTITPVGVQQYLYSNVYTGINTLSTGTSIQGIDPISGAIGVNITPSYIAVSYFICYA